MQSVRTLTSVDYPGISKVLHTFLVGNVLWVLQDPNTPTDTKRATVVFGEGLKNERVLCAILRQVLRVLVVLHKNEIVWSDIRGQNILLNSNGKVEVLLLSLRSVAQLKTRDSLPFFPPEVCERKEIEFKSDIWSFGMMALQLFNGVPPLTDITALQGMLKVSSEGKSPLDICQEEIGSISDIFRSMLDLCLQIDPSKRFTAEQLLDHDFFYLSNDTLSDEEILCQYFFSHEGYLKEEKAHESSRLGYQDSIKEQVRTSSGNKKGQKLQGKNGGVDTPELGTINQHEGSRNVEREIITERKQGSSVKIETCENPQENSLTESVERDDRQESEIREVETLGEQKGSSNNLGDKDDQLHTFNSDEEATRLRMNYTKLRIPNRHDEENVSYGEDVAGNRKKDVKRGNWEEDLQAVYEKGRLSQGEDGGRVEDPLSNINESRSEKELIVKFIENVEGEKELEIDSSTVQVESDMGIRENSEFHSVKQSPEEIYEPEDKEISKKDDFLEMQYKTVEQRQSDEYDLDMEKKKNKEKDKGKSKLNEKKERKKDKKKEKMKKKNEEK
eukprot:TRINITY_DN1303_c0_g1_i2.p1 TRINITY_DN1303_c0_g1~~TRINITY_DN1303_c0_g1_i2.p1  ORF type:complete len:559 (+),score=129.71 TRINITY_DN1303_c0_g1_i2:309-1985(+)